MDDVCGQKGYLGRCAVVTIRIRDFCNIAQTTNTLERGMYTKRFAYEITNIRA